jgi:hypothetical protein
MSDKPRIQSWRAFWPFYLGEHSLASTRWMHFVGSSLALLVLGWVIFTGSWAFTPLAVVCGYFFAWVSHFFIEKNKPASFKYPAWSFAADWVMWSLILTGRIDGELKKLGITPKQTEAAPAANP